MEDGHYSELKRSLSAISVKVLNVSSRLTLANNLDYKQALLSEKRIARDYRGLAELIGFKYNAIKKFEESEDRTMKILESWQTHPEATLNKLITYLEYMDRHDIIQELIPSLKLVIVEDSDYSELKRSLSTISVKDLNYSSRLTLAKHLNIEQEVVSGKGFSQDYRGLAELIGLQYCAIKKVEEFEDRTMRILEKWETCPDATLDKLITYLEDMDRHDIIQELIPSLKNTVETYLEYMKSLETPIQVDEENGNFNLPSFYEVSSGAEDLSSKRRAITKHDMQRRECTLYDAYVSYAEDDTLIAQELASILESSQVGLKLFIHERDMLAGAFELDTTIELIQHRCRHVLIILTPNFIKSPALEFQVRFAGNLAIEQRQRILIPVILSPCEYPPILNTVNKIDFTKPNTHDWMMDKLITSLMREDKMYQSAAYSEMHQSAAFSDSKEVPSLTKQFSKKFQQFMSFFRRKGNSSSASSSSFTSGATSGYHSQSSSNI